MNGDRAIVLFKKEKMEGKPTFASPPSPIELFPYIAVSRSIERERYRFIKIIAINYRASVLLSGRTQLSLSYNHFFSIDSFEFITS